MLNCTEQVQVQNIKHSKDTVILLSFKSAVPDFKSLLSALHTSNQRICSGGKDGVQQSQLKQISCT